MRKLQLVAIILLILGIALLALPQETLKLYKLDSVFDPSSRQISGGLIAVIGFILLIFAIKK